MADSDDLNPVAVRSTLSVAGKSNLRCGGSSVVESVGTTGIGVSGLSMAAGLCGAGCMCCTCCWTTGVRAVGMKVLAGLRGAALLGAGG